MNILYIMHVEWGWIKQRPHFIAEELDKRHRLQVLTEISYRNKNKTDNSSPVRRSILWNVPFRKRFKILRNLDILLNRNLISLLCFFYKYDFVWVTHPSHALYVEKINTPVIYDCMDDHASFHTDTDAVVELRLIEDHMFSLAEHAIFSSERLKEININKFKKGTVVKNGISSSIITHVDDAAASSSSDSSQVMVYFGTISSWFDFETVKHIIEYCPNLRIEVIGPVEIDISYKHERLIFLGPMDHASLIEYSKNADYFIMPFILNELILNVDPVKLYEYIALGKPIISIYYSGLADFTPFVNFYRDIDDINQICEKICRNQLKAASSHERVQFISKSNWASRCDVIDQILNNERRAR